MSQNGMHNPFPGLRAFEPEEDYLFFGREKETDELRRRLRTTRFLAVIGSSGSGKSSLVKSGLIPSLHAGFMAQAGSSWRVAMLRPGEDPIGNLVKALQVSEVVPAMSAVQARDKTVLEVTLRDSSLGVAEAVRHAMLPTGDNLLVVVDQFEELFRFNRSRTKHNEDEAVAFVKLLLDAAHQAYASVYVVITMRSEFIGDCMPFPGLPEAINEGLYLIPRMSRDEMRAAITKPVAVSGATIAPRLVVRLLNEVGDEMDRLPVLQHALMRTWDNWKAEGGRQKAESDLQTGHRPPTTDHQPPIDIRHYEAIGTMRSGLSQHGEEAYNDLPSERAQSIAERLFKTITDTTEEGRGVRNPAPLGRIAAVCAATEPEVAEVIETFRQPGRAFLQPPQAVPLASDSIIDISHESLMRLWDRLVGWTQEEGRSRQIYDRLAQSAQGHEAGEESLWRNPQLQIGLRWREDNRPTAAWATDETDFARAMRFLDRSRSAHLLRRALLAAVVLCLLAGAAGWIYRQYKVNRDLQAKLASVSNLKQSVAVNEKLKAEIATMQERREALNKKIQALRESNRDIEENLVTLGDKNKELAKKANVLQEDEVALVKERDWLEGLDNDLSRQGKTLESELELLKKESARIKADADSLRERSDWIGFFFECVLGCRRLVSASRPDEERKNDTKLEIFSPPPDIPENKAIQQQIADLQRELEELRIARANQVEEAAWLEKENVLLEKQRAAFLQEVQLLEQIEKGLTERQQSLQQVAAAATTQQQELTQKITRLEASTTKLRKEIEKQRATTRRSQTDNILLSRQMGLLREEAEEQRKINQNAETYFYRVASGLAGQASYGNSSAELSGLLSVAAWRLVPNSDYPEIYNALLLALRRLDEKAAQELLQPTSSTKIGTTTSAALTQAICTRVKRGFTEEEWKQSARDFRADFTSRLARPCAEK